MHPMYAFIPNCYTYKLLDIGLVDLHSHGEIHCGKDSLELINFIPRGHSWRNVSISSRITQCHAYTEGQGMSLIVLGHKNFDSC